MKVIKYPKKLTPKLLSGMWGLDRTLETLGGVSLPGIDKISKLLNDKTTSQYRDFRSLLYVIFTPYNFPSIGGIKDIPSKFIQATNIEDMLASLDPLKFSAEMKSSGISRSSDSISLSGEEYKMFENRSNGGKNDDFIKIALPIKPEAFKINTTHEWKKTPDIMAGAGKELVKGYLDAQKATGTINKVKAMGGGLVKSGKAALLSEAINKISGAASQFGAAGYTPQKQSYGGMIPATLSFSWTLTPESEEEFLDIKNIFALFQYLSTYSSGSLINSSTTTSINMNPALWLIQFPVANASFPNVPMLVKNNEFLCVITNIEIGTGTGEFMNWTEDGGLTEMKLGLTFSEYFSVGSAEQRYGKFDEFTKKYGV